MRDRREITGQALSSLLVPDLDPASIIDGSHPYAPIGGFELCPYSIRELAYTMISTNQSTVSGPMRVSHSGQDRADSGHK